MKRRWSNLHLFTRVLILVVAGVFLCENIYPQYYWNVPTAPHVTWAIWGYPLPAYYYSDDEGGCLGARSMWPIAGYLIGLRVSEFHWLAVAFDLAFALVGIATSGVCSEILICKFWRKGEKANGLR